jgi:DNA-binding MarR family transcriptional regulator
MIIEIQNLIDKINVSFLALMKNELEKLKVDDINPVQAYILYKLGEKEVNVGDISNNKYYNGSNVSYNLKNLVEKDYFTQTANQQDKRSSRIRISAKGIKLYKDLHKKFEKYEEEFKSQNILEKTDIFSIQHLLAKLENALNHKLRS